MPLPAQQNPEEVGRHRRPMHHKSRSFATKTAALDYWRKRGRGKRGFNGDNQKDMVDSGNDNVYMLTGKPGLPDDSCPWDFQLIGDPFNVSAELRDWMSLDFDSSSWAKVSLPNHWQLQGFDVPLYTNTSYPFRFDPPFTIRDGVYHLTLCDQSLGGTENYEMHPKEPGVNATGLFRRKFDFPNGWKENGSDRIFLVFEGVDSCFKAWLNGKFIGYSQDSCLSAEFDVTDYINLKSPESGVIAVEVSRWCDGSYLEDQDKWWLSGIYREVYFIKKPRSLICDVEFKSDTIFDGCQPVSSIVNVSVLAEGVRSCIDPANPVENDCHWIRVELWKNIDDIAAVATVTGEFSTSEYFKQRHEADKVLNCDTAEVMMASYEAPGTVEVVLSISSPSMWSAEDPNLYILIATLHASKESAISGDDGIHTESFKVGIRQIEFGGDDNCLLINKKKVTIAGVNRLEFDSLTGRSISKQSMLSDAKLLKKLNFNAVRTAHYPQHSFWMELCDEIGFYMIDEANIETHGFQVFGYPMGYLSNDIKWRGAMACRVSRMVERDKNHPCVIGWSLGNESGHGPTHDLMADWIRVRDPRRFVHYESGGSCTHATDVICPMYQRPKWCIEQSINDPGRRPVILCEYAHAMGNSGGCLKDYWTLFRDKTHPRIQGGFIWDFVDQGLATVKQPNKFLYGGDFGEFPHSSNFCCNGLTSPLRVPFPEAIEAAFFQSPIEVRLVSQSERELLIEIINHRSFLTLSDLQLTVTPFVCSEVFCDEYSLKSFIVDVSKLEPNERVVLNILPSVLESFSTLSSKTHFGVGIAVDATKLPDSSIWNQGEAVCLFHTSFELNLFSVNEHVKPIVEKGKIDVVECENAFSLRWDSGVSIKFSKNGQLIGLTNSSEVELLKCPLEVCLSRAATDNDNGASFTSYSYSWRMAGYDSLCFEYDRPLHHTVHFNGDVEVNSSFKLVSTTKKSLQIECHMNFLCNAVSGVVDVTSTVTPPMGFPVLPRIGLRFALPSTFERVKYLGLGPHEAYDDRKSSVYFGVFNAVVDDLHTHYLRPQENGRRADPRWLLFQSLEENTSIGIFVNDFKRTEGYGFSASRFSLEELTKKVHDHDLEPAEDNKIFVHIDSRMMGIGGYDSWSPNVDAEFLIAPQNRAEVTKLSFQVLPFVA